MPTAPMMWNLLWKTSLMASGQDLGGQTKTLVTHTPCSGHTPFLPRHLFHTQITGGSRERVGDTMFGRLGGWMGRTKRDIRMWVPYIQIRNHGRGVGPCFGSISCLGSHPIIKNRFRISPSLQSRAVSGSKKQEAGRGAA